MKRLLFFIRAYPNSLRLELLLLFLVELIRISILRRFFHNYLVESRAILGFVYERQGLARPQEDGMQLEFALNQTMVSLVLRWNSSDFLVFSQVFIREEYRPLTELKQQTPMIIDAGSNIGCTSIYLSTFYKGAKIIAIEPDADNFKQLKKNFLLSGLQDVSCLSIALWQTDGLVSLTNDFRDHRNWSVKVAEEGNMHVPAKTLKTILSEFSISQIDILKMDIEGAEEPIFENDNTIIDILKNVKRIAIEVHDCRTTVENKLKMLGFDLKFAGETLFVTSRAL